VMCLVPYGPQLPPVPPNERAAKIADYFRVVIILHFVLAVSMFFCTRYVDGIFDLLGAAVGYMSIRNPEGFNFQYILCYVTYSGFVFVYAIVRMILYFAGSSSSEGPSGWQSYIYIATLITGPVIYILAAVLGYHLYKELRSMMVPDAGAYGGGDGAGYMPQGGQASGVASDAWRHQEVHPSEPATIGAGGGSAVGGARAGPGAAPAPGFRAFSGQGHKLGGN